MYIPPAIQAMYTELCTPPGYPSERNASVIQVKYTELCKIRPLVIQVKYTESCKIRPLVIQVKYTELYKIHPLVIQVKYTDQSKSCVLSHSTVPGSVKLMMEDVLSIPSPSLLWQRNW